MASFTSAFTYTGHVAYRLKISPSSPAGTLLLSSISVTTNAFVCKCLQISRFRPFYSGLERQVELDNLSGFSSDDLAEGYFEADAYSDELKNSLNRYEELCLRNDLTEDERAERAEIRIKFKNISTELSGVAKERFEDIERRRKAND